MKTVYKPTQKELDDYSDNRSKYCIDAATERRKLCMLKQMQNRYSTCNFQLPNDYKERKINYLNKYFYFELNTHKIVTDAPKGRYAYGNILFTTEALKEKQKELEQ